MYVCVWRKGTRTRQDKNRRTCRGRERPEKSGKASDQIDERRRPTRDNHVAPCSAQSMAAKTTVMRMIIKDALCHGRRSRSRVGVGVIVVVVVVIVADGKGKDYFGRPPPTQLLS
jgi:hypothetical protein